MPFDDDYEDLEPNKSRLKNISTQKSIFDNNMKKPTQKDLEELVKNVQESNFNYKQKTADLAVKFRKLIEDKTLSENKNLFSVEMEKELLINIMQLASDINNDPNESEGIGSLSWIAQLFKTSLYQRDRINTLEYNLMQLEKKFLLIKERVQALDKQNNNE